MRVYILLVRENYSDCTKISGVFPSLEKALEIKNAFDKVKKMLTEEIGVDIEIEEWEVAE